MFVCSDCGKLFKGTDTLPNVDGSATVQCVACHGQATGAAPTRVAVVRVNLALGPSVDVFSYSHQGPEESAANRAFCLVSPDEWKRGDWKDTIHAVLLASDLETAGVTIDEVAAAIEFFTSTKAKVTETTLSGNFRTEFPNPKLYVVEADGYRRGPAGDR